MREVFQAVHQDDVRALFEGLGLLEDLGKRKIRCHICGDPITIDTFRAVTRHNGKLMFACVKDACLAALAEIGK